MLDVWVENATDGLLVAARSAVEHPSDGESDAVFWDTLGRLDVLLRVRKNLRP